MNCYEDESLNHLFVRVRHLHHQCAVGRFESLGLNYGQPPILFELLKKDGLTQKELSQLRNVSPATITVTLKRMEKAGWITRRVDSEDSRVSRVYLTDKSRQLQLPLKALETQLDDETFRSFNDTDKALMRRFLLQMWDNLSISGK